MDTCSPFIKAVSEWVAEDTLTILDASPETRILIINRYNVLHKKVLNEI